MIEKILDKYFAKKLEILIKDILMNYGLFDIKFRYKDNHLYADIKPQRYKYYQKKALDFSNDEILYLFINRSYLRENILEMIRFYEGKDIWK